MSKYNELTFGQAEAIVNKLGGMEGVRRFLSGELIVSSPAKVWKTWRTIKLGTGLKTADDFIKVLKKADCEITDWGKDIIGKPAFTVATEEMEVELVNVSGAELGFTSNVTRADIYKRAVELGLDLCPNEVGPQLRLQYKDQPEGEWLLVAMEPIIGSGGGLSVFIVGRDGGGELWLDGYDGHPGDVWGPGGRWLFLRRK
jgi:hypothetical protein